jgi:hypothetical protein
MWLSANRMALQRLSGFSRRFSQALSSLSAHRPACGVLLCTGASLAATPASLRGERDLLAFPDVFDFFALEFTGLSRRRFSLFSVFACPLKSFFPRHDAPFRTRILRQSIGAQRKDNLNTANRLEMFNTGTSFVKNRDASVRRDSTNGGYNKEGEEAEPAQPSRLVFSQGTRTHIFFS